MRWPARDTAWDEALEQEVRPYAITAGRTTPRHRLRLVSLLTAGREPPRESTPETAQVVAACRDRPYSVAELAATLHQPVQVTKILISDLLDAGAVVLVLPDDDADVLPRDNPDLLEAVLVGLRKKFAV